MDLVQLKFIVGFEFLHTVAGVASVLLHVALQVLKVCTDVLNYASCDLEALSLR